MLRRSHADSAGNFWQPVELEIVANPDFGNLKHLQNPGHLLLTAPSMTGCREVHIATARIVHVLIIISITSI